MLLTATGSAQTTVMLIWIVALFAIMYFMMWKNKTKAKMPKGAGDYFRPFSANCQGPCKRGDMR